ncbi:C-type lectin domain family 2 member E-like [Microtus ochrogaster]|uniref:C-type lectin domain family 2 member E-like n=1 Tax=Microtus ochrogaster TaxID=79684 RepID=A0ABM1TT41_MICOH|nr:C-type lectin domain family 2 member E-like [Microtus ochrogaster]
MMVENFYRASQTSHVSGHHRTTFDAKKLLTLWTLLCGGVVVLLWGFFSFPRKFGTTRITRNKTCDDEAKICMNAWHKINQNCFFLIQHENSWPVAKQNCENLEAHLAKFNKQNELEALMSLVNEGSSYWLGLNKRNLDKLWLWTDGTKYNDLKEIHDYGECAFLHKRGIDSTTCDDLKDYICMKVGQCP